MQKSNNGGLCLDVEVGKGDNRQSEGLSPSRLRDLANWYVDRAADQQQRTGGVDVDSAELDAGLRQVLSEQVLPEFVEVEFERVMAEVFRV